MFWYQQVYNNYSDYKFDFIYQEWIPNVAGKQAAYHAMAEYHQAMVAQEKKEFGEEIARLQVLIEIH